MHHVKRGIGTLNVRLFDEIRTFFERNWPPRFARQTERSGGAGRKGVEGERNSRPALAFAAAEFRASETSAPPKNF